ncbi:DNA-directed RNA polymerase subunit beta' [Patescibacteria group bacterium]|nr:DNA-directed RNA polymerase subunit beta' [Patescibacteria group bacterium]MBU1015888.1 DNA-directed RNA polymerase subunit beta' [Patescibacteria group bacterium]MBU1685057.1 DNA-directed RNA polymerase subunit beta' [Patescibacteria group bacterium]MBU1938180.1 DNA-directed RNA polymerase subunit beta' [Patescibacteria group bacterium]
MTQLKGPKKHEDFDSITLSVASPESVLEWSYGEVTKPETINYRTQKPERDGLFCEKIFGPTKNWECYCGKYKRIRYKGVVCEKCGVEVTRSIVRRERMGHISLAVPVTHIWFLRSTPSRLGLILDLPIKAIEQVIYFAAYIITNVDQEAKKEALENLDKDFLMYKKQIQEEFKSKSNDLKIKARSKKKGAQLTEDQIDELDETGEDVGDLVHAEDSYARKIEELTMQHHQAKDDLESLAVGKVVGEIEYRELSMKFGHVFHAGTGAESIRKILENLDLKVFIKILEEERKRSTGQKYKKLLRRIRLASALMKAEIRPEWMVIVQLPVIPPDLRPMVQLDGGRFAASDLNDLYRRVINRNNRLKRLMAIGAPEVICRNEKRMLQEAVDTLFNNAARAGRAVFTAGDKRKLRSLSDMLKGKQGRFRQNLLGKRVDYSGRSVIVVGPQLKLSECGIPKEMALKLFKPFVVGELIRQELAHNVKGAERLIDEGKKEVWDILENETSKRLVLLNRAPTLHRLGIQAFKPLLIDGKAIQIHPLVCAAFNADFDGDQMAVHLPLSENAQKEARELMLATTNLLKPSAGEPIITPSQDMVLGVYYLTRGFKGREGEGMMFSDINEAVNAYRQRFVHLQAFISGRAKGKIVENTTVGRMIFNTFLPEEIDYVNETIGKNGLKALLAQILDTCGPETTAKVADEFKRVGFKFATKSGITISAFDMLVPEERKEMIAVADETVRKINNQYWKGWITEEERYNHAIRLWSFLKNDVTNKMIQKFDNSPENNIYYMIDSGARGNWGQITQLCGMKGLVANPSGKTIELPIKSNLKDGFSILEYFIATHGGRKGKSDTALKTAEAGYLTRRLVDAVQDIVIKEADCGNVQEHLITREESNRIGEGFEKRIFGRTIAAHIVNPKTGEVIAKKGVQIDNDIAAGIKKAQVAEVLVRAIMTCKVENGICQQCYGFDLGTNKIVDLGTAVGIIAAQSIGEPGTQLTMRTFHMGGVAEGSDITQGLTRVEELFEARNPKGAAVLAEISGKALVKTQKGQIEVTLTAQELGEDSYQIPPDFEAVVKKGEKIKPKQIIARSKTEKHSVKATDEGQVVKVTGSEIVTKHTRKHEKVYTFDAKEKLLIKNNDLVAKGVALNRGHLNLQELMESTNVYTAQKYIMTEVQHIYASQGQTINDKHIEIIVKQMFSKVRVINPGDSNFLPGELVNAEQFENSNEGLRKAKKNVARADRLLLGISRVAITTNSWLSAASFQETIRVLVEASTTRKVDNLKGLKENVIIGKLIPAGHIYKANYEKKDAE